MAQPQNEVLERIQQYAASAREYDDDPMDVTNPSTEARLDRTIKELQARVQQQKAALAEVVQTQVLEISLCQLTLG